MLKRKHFKPPDLNDPYYGLKQFNLVFSYVKDRVKSLETHEAIDFLQFIVDCLKTDISSEFRLNFLNEDITDLNWGGKEYNGYTLPFSFPMSYYKNSTLYNISTNIYVDVDLAITTLWAKTRKTSSLISLLEILKTNKFEFNENLHRAYYLDYLDICTFISDGNHSLTIGSYYKKGTIKAFLIKVTEMFSVMNTDGFMWYLDDDYKSKYPVDDFRMVLIYEIAKLKYRYEQKIDTECATL